MKKLTANLFGIIFWPVTIYLGWSGKVSWWVILLIILSDIKIDYILRKG